MMKAGTQEPDYIGNSERDVISLLRLERDHVREIRDPIRSAHREEIDPSNKKEIPWTGLALSGGGIRSATFNLGVLQALSKKGLLHRLDYLSTVSGGGYIGTSLTWFLSKKGQEACPVFLEETKNKKTGYKGTQFPFGTSATNFPYGVDAPGKILSGRDSVTQKQLLNHLRNRGNYLAPGNGLTLLTLIGVVIRNSMINLLLWLPLLTAMILGAMLLLPSDPQGEKIPVIFHWTGILSAVLIVFFMCIGILFSVLSKVVIDGLNDDALANRIRVCFDRWGTRVLEIGLALGIIYAIAWMGTRDNPSLTQLAVSGLCIIVAIAVGASTIFKPGSPVINRLLVPLASGFLAIGLFVLAFNLAYLAYRAEVNEALAAPDSLLGSTWLGLELSAFVIFSAAAVALIIIFLTNLNVISIARFYRDRLKEAYLPGDKELETYKKDTTNTPELYLKDVYPLEELYDDPGPYPIINTNVILVDSKDGKYRTRGGDNFILSPLYCGSEATGWQKTDMYNGGRLTVSTAMAISGAAINPHAGPGGQGSSRNRLVSFLMAALNLRLGMWMPNPGKKLSSKSRARWIFPNFLASAFYGVKSVLGRKGYHRKSFYLQLSDGGHFDNLGLYELLRRELDLIIVSDASADPGFTFSDLRRSLRYAEMDLDTEISFDGDLSELMPEGVSGVGSPAGEASKGYVHATIRYKRGGVGELYYIKSTMIQNSRVRTRSYKFEHPQFPDETTADQFFDEAQFAAYRDLGYNTTTKMIEHSNLYPLD